MSQLMEQWTETVLDVGNNFPKYDPNDYIMFVVGMPTKQQLMECWTKKKILFVMVFAPYTEPNQELDHDPLAATAVRISEYIKQWASLSPKRTGFLMYSSVNLVGYYKTVNNKQKVLEQFKETYTKPDGWFAPAGFDRGSITTAKAYNLPCINQVKEM